MSHVFSERSNLAERYTRLCRAYIQLAEKFQKLDVEHMNLKSKVVPLLRTVKATRQQTEQLQHENTLLQEKLLALTTKYEDLKAFEVLLQPETQATLNEAEEQLALVSTTMQEMETDSDPDLNDMDKSLLDEYSQDPDEFEQLNYT